MQLKLDAPPVVETVFSVQFVSLPKFTLAHAGWYWKKYLDASWTVVEQAAPIADQFERFDGEMWEQRIPFQLRPASAPDRLQIRREDDQRMIQLQATRFVYNWKKGSVPYASYDTLRPEFDQEFQRFSSFAMDAGLGTLDPNQWEITYVNHIPNGQIWNTPQDWPKIIRGFMIPQADGPGASLGGFDGEWHIILPAQRGRLHVSIHHARIGSAAGPEVLDLRLTARGPIDEQRGWTIDNGLSIGHRSIVDTFSSVTTEEAQLVWKRRK